MRASVHRAFGSRPMAAAIRLISVAVVVAWSSTAVATPINLLTGSSWTVTPGTTGTLTLAAINIANGTSVSTFNGWSLGLQLLPGVGATGTATIGDLAYDPPIALNPTSNPALLDADPSAECLALELDTPTNGTLDYVLVALGNNSDTSTTWSSGQSYNLIYLPVTLSANASGTWTLYAVNNQYNVSGWITSTAEDNSWGNLAASEGSSLTLGSVAAMSPVPVPEPGSLALAGMAAATGIGAGFLRLRDRRARGALGRGLPRRRRRPPDPSPSV